MTCATSHRGSGVELKLKADEPSLLRHLPAKVGADTIRLGNQKDFDPTWSHRYSVSMKNNYIRRTKQDRQKENAYAFYGGC